jgi:hypothetical protein
MGSHEESACFPAGLGEPLHAARALNLLDAFWNWRICPGLGQQAVGRRSLEALQQTIQFINFMGEAPLRSNSIMA